MTHHAVVISCQHRVTALINLEVHIRVFVELPSVSQLRTKSLFHASLSRECSYLHLKSDMDGITNHGDLKGRRESQNDD